MNYKIDVYEIDELNQYRFVLGSISTKTLCVFGINPSTADDKTPDHTIRKVMGFAERNGYASFVMFNLYPKRATYPHDLPDLADEIVMRKNIEIISKIVSQVVEQQKRCDVLLAWGNSFYLRDYLGACLKEIYVSLNKHPIRWLRIGELLKSGQPRHPSRPSYELKFENVDMNVFLSR